MKQRKIVLQFGEGDLGDRMFLVYMRDDYKRDRVELPQSMAIAIMKGSKITF